MIDVLFFGRMADLMGQRRTCLAVDTGRPTLFALRDSLFGGAVDLGRVQLDRICMSVNQQVVRSDRTLDDGDEIAFFSVFSGG